MLINELPDDCLLAIFDQFNNLHHLMACYKVCLKWSHLIAKRTKKVKYFIDWPDYSPDYVFYEDRDLIDVASLSTLFSNLIVAEFSNSFSVSLKFEDIAEFVRNHQSLKGMINSSCVVMEEYCDKLEMLATDRIEPGSLRNCSSLKQLHVYKYTLDDFKRDAQYLPNLETLRILINDSYLNGPVLEKLKVVEMASCLTRTFYGFQFMDSCPNLQSAHIVMNVHRLFVDETLKHESLQDLVIHFFYKGQIWNDLKRTLMKYPNLKHFSLSTEYMTDEYIEQLVHILPNLVIFDVRGCRGVTQRAASYVQNYFERNGRSTKFYFNGNRHEIKSYWPQLYTNSSKICRGFDFMKHCFLQCFHLLPRFLIPIYY